MNAPLATPDSSVLLVHPDNREPDRFTQAELNWLPALAPLEIEALTERHYEGLTERGRAQSPYFRLLARDPEVLGARTRTDKDIFYNGEGGLPRAERELAATAVSRVNGCIYCASVHARFATRHSGRGEDVDRLLHEGATADLGSRWNAVARAAERLTRTPAAFDVEEVRRLRETGLRDDELTDLVFAASFFNWANRLMLSLGEPEGEAPAS